MATSGKISIIDLLIFSAPKGESPYAYAANFIAHVIPDKPDWYYYQVIPSGVLNAINLILTLINFMVVYRRRSTSKESRALWFFRTQYGHPSHIPYIMPNPLTMFLFWNSLFMLVFQPYIWLNYVAYKTPSRAITSRIYFWYGFVFIWDGAGIWMSAFGTLYAALLPRVIFGEEHDMSLLLHPVLLNSLCLGMPLLLFIAQITTSIMSQIAWGKFVNVQFDLIEDLTTLSNQWLASNGTSVDSTLRKFVSAQGNNLLPASTQSKDAFVRSAWTSATWYFLCLIVFTPAGIWLLVTIKRTASQPSYKSEQPSGRCSSAGGAVHMQQRLRVGYATVLLQFLATIICLGTAAGSFGWVAYDIDRVVANPNLHAVAILLSDWVFGAVGTTVNILILIRMSFKPASPALYPSKSHSSTLPQSQIYLQGPPRNQQGIEKPVSLHTASQTDVEFELGDLTLDPAQNLSSSGRYFQHY